MNFYQLNDPKSLRAKVNGRFNKIDNIVIAYNRIDIDEWYSPKLPNFLSAPRVVGHVGSTQLVLVGRS